MRCLRVTKPRDGGKSRKTENPSRLVGQVIMCFITDLRFRVWMFVWFSVARIKFLYFVVAKVECPLMNRSNERSHGSPVSSSVQVTTLESCWKARVGSLRGLSVRSVVIQAQQENKKENVTVTRFVGARTVSLHVLRVIQGRRLVVEVWELK